MRNRLISFCAFLFVWSMLLASCGAEKAESGAALESGITIEQEQTEKESAGAGEESGADEGQARAGEHELPAAGEAGTPGLQGTQDDLPEAQEETEQLEAAEPEILHFVDVFGEEYQVEIDPGVEKHRYIAEGFVREGERLKYLDEGHTSRLGIDVSHHQGNIDWDAVAVGGYEFAILRIGYRGYGEEGILKADSKFEEYYSEAKRVGLDVGVYFFAQAVNEEEAGEEADFVLDILGGRQLDLPVTYDPESILDDEARTDNVTGEQFTKNSAAFCKRISEGGYKPMIYANMLWEAYNLELKQLKGIPLWYADYEALPQTPYNFEFWQYSNEGSVNGVEGVCDLDIQIIKLNDGN